MSSDSSILSLRKPSKRNNLFNVLRVVIVFMLLCTLAFPMSIRADSKTTVVKLWVGNSVMSIDGVRQPIDAQGTKPIIVESRTLVPIRAVIESFDGSVAWDADARKVTVILKENTLELWIGQSSASLNGYSLPVDSANPKVFPIIVSGRTMIPLRFVAESFGIDVQYDDKTKMITLTYVAETTPIVQLPVAPILASPTNNSTLNNSNITFTWTAVTGVDYYKLQIIKDGLTLNSFESITTNSYTLTGTTLADGTYSWQVAAHNSAGLGSWSAPLTFSISKQMSITDIAKFVDRVVFIEVSGIEDGQPFKASGSGFIISGDGTIVTNYHVIDGATSGTVTLNDKTKFDIVSVLGYSKTEDKDLAIIKINASNLPVCDIGDSSKVQVGESVVAIGSPLGLEETQNTVSNGIISKIRDNGIIQTTAPISHGSSGGPLFNMYGKVIGAIEAFYPGGENLNLAVPINWLKTIDTSLNMTLKQVYEKEYGSLVVLPGVPSLISPANESVLTTLTPALSWTPVSGADSYGVWVGTGRIADDQYEILHQSVTGTSFTIPTGILAIDEEYTWSVDAHNPSGFSGWSDDWHFSIAQSTLPGVPTLVSPLNESVLTTTTPTLSWTPVSGADYYAVWVGTGRIADEQYKIWYQNVTTGTSVIVPAGKLTAGQQYTWEVCAHNSAGFGSWSDAWHFSTAKPTLTAPVLLSPDEKYDVWPSLDNYTISFNWFPVAGASSYTLWIGSGLSGTESTNVYKKVTTGTSLSVSTNILLSGQIYTWAVGVNDGAGNVVWSVDRHFSIVDETEPVLVYPTNYSTIYTNPTMMWFSVTGADSYDFLLYEGNSIVNNTPILRQTVYYAQYTLPAYMFTRGKTYCWYVFAYSGEYLIGWSDVFIFYVAP
jgi:serine protease Do